MKKNRRGQKESTPPLVEAAGLRGVKIRGRGILDLGLAPPDARSGDLLGAGSQDILVEGIIMLDAPVGRDDPELQKMLSCAMLNKSVRIENSDGIDVCNSQDVLVEDCFLRNNDDEVCVKTLLPPPAAESKNIVVRHCVICNYRAGGLGITNETRANISHVLFQNCDIIHDSSPRMADVRGAGHPRLRLGHDQRHPFRGHPLRGVLPHAGRLLDLGRDIWGRQDPRVLPGVTFQDIQMTGNTAARL